MATAATVAAGLSVATTAYSLHERRQAREEQQKAVEIQRRRRELRNARLRRQAAAQARIQRARLIAEASTRGAIGSSAVLGASGSIRSQLSERIGFSTGEEAAAARTAGLQNIAQSRLGNAATAEAIGGLPSQVGIQPSFASVFTED